MTGKAKQTPATTPVAAKSVPAKTEAQKTAETFDWAQLPDAEVPAYTRVKAPIANVEETTPEAIKARVKESYAAYKPAGHDKEHPNKVVLSWRKQECGTKERAAEFLKLARRYAENVAEPRMTLRAGIAKDAPTVVRYMAKPLEVRGVKGNAA